MAFIEKRGDRDEGVMMKRRQIDKKGKLNTQWFSLRKKKKKKKMYFQQEGKKALKAHELNHILS